MQSVVALQAVTNMTERYSFIDLYGLSFSFVLTRPVLCELFSVKISLLISIKNDQEGRKEFKICDES